MFSRYQAIKGAFKRNIDDKKDNDMTECELTEILDEQNKQEVDWHNFASLDSYSGALLDENENLESDEPMQAKKMKGLILMNLEVKDALYYDDLIYEIKSLAGFEQEENKETEERILERQEGLTETIDGRTINKLPIFQQELFSIISRIISKANGKFCSLNEISEYPKLVNNALNELERKKIDIKNALYYDDLIYKIKDLAGFYQKENKETEKRILEREKDFETEINGITCYELSNFTTELFEIVQEISKKTGETFKNLHQISNYPEFVDKTLIEINQRKMAILWEPIVKEHPKSGLNIKQTYGDDTHYGFVEHQEESEQYESKGLYPASPSSVKRLMLRKSIDNNK